MPRLRVEIQGAVQGVGFRPFVYRLATELQLRGWVLNDTRGVFIEVEGPQPQLDAFLQRLPVERPPRAIIHALTHAWLPANGYTGFEIRRSAAHGARTALVLPDMGACPDCLAEVFTPADRRHAYPFTNCTNCGPRFTIIEALPYDRPHTTMRQFTMCPACQAEYEDPTDRRFHAQPNACPACGPQLALWQATLDAAAGAQVTALATGQAALAAAAAALVAGQIVAVKGLGGFHLLVNGRNQAAVARLRARKQRPVKPLALMARDLAQARQLCEVSPAAAALLTAPEAPILLLPRRPEADVAASVAPGHPTLGVMLPYTPLHWLIFHEAAGQPAGTDWMQQLQNLVLVMTSANPGGEPLVIRNKEALERLAGIADGVLMHDRDVVVRCDDSVVRFSPSPLMGEGRGGGDWAAMVSGASPPTQTLPREGGGNVGFIRRARGYTPRSIRLPRSGPSVLALGGYLKNTICVTRGDEAFVSQHIGSLDNPATCGMLMEVTNHLLDILQVRPEAVAHDLHPDFFSSRHALELADRWNVPAVAVQHHHAHIAAVVAEHGVTEPILGLALDGVGLGSDGSAWGGELLRVEGSEFSRLGHLSPLPLPGGDKAAKEPWRMAAAALFRLRRTEEIPLRFPSQPLARQLHVLLEHDVHCPPTTSLGRWFDAAAGLLGAREVMAYEGQAAMLLEGLAEGAGEVEPLADGYSLDESGRLDLLPLLARLADEPDAAFGAALFHATLAQALADWTERAARREGLTTVALGGGCFLNHILSRNLTRLLTERGLTVLTANQAPPNDGGLSLGQAWVAMQQIR